MLICYNSPRNKYKRQEVQDGREILGSTYVPSYHSQTEGSSSTFLKSQLTNSYENGQSDIMYLWLKREGERCSRKRQAVSTLFILIQNSLSFWLNGSRKQKVCCKISKCYDHLFYTSLLISLLSPRNPHILWSWYLLSKNWNAIIVGRFLTVHSFKVKGSTHGIFYEYDKRWEKNRWEHFNSY